MNTTVLYSDSGAFAIDENGIVQSFRPSDDNPFIYENIPDEVWIQQSIRTLVVPDGVKGFCSEFMRGVWIKEKFILPDSLISIGSNSFDFGHQQHSVFANSILPEVKIPSSVQTIGNFAFGGSRIKLLQLPVGLQSPYGRQFKDSYIEELKLPAEWEGKVGLDQYNQLDARQLGDAYDYLHWPSTKIGKLIFYK